MAPAAALRAERAGRVTTKEPCTTSRVCEDAAHQWMLRTCVASGAGRVSVESPARQAPAPSLGSPEGSSSARHTCKHSFAGSLAKYPAASAQQMLLGVLLQLKEALQSSAASRAGKNAGSSSGWGQEHPAAGHRRRGLALLGRLAGCGKLQSKVPAAEAVAFFLSSQ